MIAGYPSDFGVIAAWAAAQDYGALQPTTRALFISLDDALASLYKLVDALAIPEDEATAALAQAAVRKITFANLV